MQIRSRFFVTMIFVGVILLSLSTSVKAGTPHSATGTVQYGDGSSPSTLNITAYITSRAGETLGGTHYGGGSWAVQVGNFPTAWSAGDVLHVDFNDGAGGTASVEVTMTNNPVDNAGTSTIPRPDISVSPGSKNYGDVEKNSSASQSFTITNTSSLGDLSITGVSLTGGDAAHFSIDSDEGTSPLGPGGTRTVEVSFNSDGTGSKSANLQITSDDPDEGQVDVGLSGNGIVIPDIDVSPGSNDYGNVVKGETSAHTFTVNNTGTGDLDIGTVSLTGANSDQFSISSDDGTDPVAPGGSRDIEVTFAPTSTGAKSATLSIASDDPDENPFNVGLSGTGVEPEIDISPTSKAYGDVLVGSSGSETFTVTNSGTSDLNVSGVSLTGANADQFSIDAGGGAFSLAPSATRDIDVSFNPTSLGAKSATLSISSDDQDEGTLNVGLSGTGVQPDISISPTSKDYGSVVFNSGSESQTFTVTNDGTADLNVSSTTLTGTHTDQFSIDSGGGSFTLGPGATRDIQVSFTPTSAGAKTASLSIASDDPDEDPLDAGLSGTGIATPTPDITASPNPTNFPNTVQGGSRTETISVGNNGTADLNISSVTITGTNSDQFNIESDDGTNPVTPGGSRSITVSFNPSSTGAKTAALRVSSDDPDEDPYDVTLNGTGVAPDISVSPTLKDYGEVEVGTSASQTFTVSNDGTSNLNISSVSLTGTNSAQFSIDSDEGTNPLAPGATREIQVSFNPGTTGLLGATLRIASDDPDENPLDVGLAGEGVTIPDIDVSPASNDYGNVNLGSSGTRTFTVTNSGTGTLNVSGTSLTGADAGQFSIDTGGGSFTLAPSGTRDIKVDFYPTTYGAKTAALSIASDDPDENPLDISLTGTGIAPDISASPVSNDYGNVVKGQSVSHSFTISNDGNTDLNISDVSLTGTNADQFNIESDDGTDPVPSGGSRNIEVSFNPTVLGAQSASLQISSDDPDENPFNISLNGTGVEPDIDITPTSKNYGNVLVGESGSQTFTVTNTGTSTLNVSSTTLTGTDAGQFSIDSGGGSFALAPSGTRDIAVSFNPTSIGAKTATFQIASDDPDESTLNVSLAGTGVAPDIGITPTTKNFGDVLSNSGVESQTFTVSNNGDATLEVSATSIVGTNADQFNINSGGGTFSLAPAATRDISVSFEPSSIGSKTATLRIASNDPDENPLDVALSGNGIAPDITASPNPHDYGDVLTGSSDSEIITVENAGDATLNVSSVSLTGTNPTEFNIDGGGGSFSLAPSGTRDVTVSFNPDSKGAKSASLRFASDDPDEDPYDVSLSGRGVEPDIDVSPTSKNYGNINVNESRTHTFTVTNTGTANLSVSSTTLTGGDAGQFSINSGGGSFSLPPTESRDIVVGFNPTTTGTKSTTLQIVSDDPDEGTVDVGLSGKGTLPDIAVNPTSKDYGVVEKGESETQVFTVSNTGDGDLEVTGETIIGAHADQFNIDSGTVPFTLTPGQTHDVTVSFNPTGAGAKSATLRFTSDDPDENPLDVGLSGTGVIIPDIAVSPDPKNYGDVEINTTDTQTFTVTNEGTADLSVTATVLIGTDANQFSIDSGGGAFTLNPGGTQYIDVSFNPTTLGTKSATLRFSSNDPDEDPKDVGLQGVCVEDLNPQPDINVDFIAKDYGSVLVGSRKSQNFTMQNVGIVDLLVRSIELVGTNTGDFEIVSGGYAVTVGPGLYHNVMVDFVPGSPGPKSAALRFNSNDPDENPLDIPLTGIGQAVPNPDIAIAPESKDFGSVQLGASATQIFAVTNDGTADLNVTATTLIGDHPDQFIINSGGAPFTLPAGNTKDLEVSFNPTILGAKTATLQLVSNDADESPLDVPLSGEGVPVPIPDIAVDPTEKSYGEVQLGTTKAQTFVISNPGTANLNVTATTLIGDHPDQFNIESGGAPFVLAPGTTRDLVLAFKPTALGDKSAKLQIASNDPDENPLNITLQGKGIPLPVPDIHIDPVSKYFGDMTVGNSKAHTFVLSNKGLADLVVAATTLGGTDPDQFNIDSGGGSYTLAPKGTRNITVSFKPTSEGEKIASLQIASNDPDENPLDIPLTGNAFLTDNEPPFIVNASPPDGAQAVPKNTNIQFHIKDAVTGVDRTTLQVDVDGTTIVDEGFDMTGGNVTISSHSPSYTVVYDPASDFTPGTTVTVNVSSSDLAFTANAMTTSFSFDIADIEVTVIDSDTVGAEGGTVTDDSTDIQIVIPAGALEDSTEITIGQSDNLPALPDTVDGIGLSYHFGPEGLQFADSVEIRIPYTQADLDSAGVTDPLDLSIYYYLTSSGEWVKLNIVRADAQFVYVKVKEFCYLVIGKVSGTTSIHPTALDGQRPIKPALKQNHPNPFNPGTEIQYHIAKSGQVNLTIYNSIGQRIRTLVNGQMPVGAYSVKWDGLDDLGRSTGSGIYLYVLRTENRIFSKKMLKLE